MPKPQPLLVNEFRVIDSSGAVFWLEARSRAEIVDGVPVILGGMTIYITHRKRSEESLVASEQRYRVLTELSPQFFAQTKEAALLGCLSAVCGYAG